jgi:hypothetical protein
MRPRPRRRCVNRGGNGCITDGPFAETREQLGGYTIIDANDLDDAYRDRERASSLERGSEPRATIEVRPIVDLGGSGPTVPGENR